MVLAWLPFPGQPPHVTAWLCAGIRSTARDRPAAPGCCAWALKPNPAIRPPPPRQGQPRTTWQ